MNPIRYWILRSVQKVYEKFQTEISFEATIEILWGGSKERSIITFNLLYLIYNIHVRTQDSVTIEYLLLIKLIPYINKVVWPFRALFGLSYDSVRRNHEGQVEKNIFEVK